MKRSIKNRMLTTVIVSIVISPLVSKALKRLGV